MKFQYPYNTATGAQDSTLTWTNGNPQIGQNGSIPAYQTWVNPMTEVLNVIQNAGITPSDADLSQLWEAINKIVSSSIAAIPPVVIPPIPVYTGSQGVKIVNDVASLDFNDLSEDDAPIVSDLIAFYQTAAGQHVKTTFGNFANQVLALATAPAINPASIYSVYALQTSTSMPFNVEVVVPFTGSSQFGNMNGGVFTFSQTGVFNISSTFGGNMAMPNNEGYTYEGSIVYNNTTLVTTCDTGYGGQASYPNIMVETTQLVAVGDTIEINAIASGAPYSLSSIITTGRLVIRKEI